eukprot:5996895-Prymnesium_polylepis.1
MRVPGPRVGSESSLEPNSLNERANGSTPGSSAVAVSVGSGWSASSCGVSLAMTDGSSPMPGRSQQLHARAG